MGKGLLVSVLLALATMLVLSVHPDWIGPAMVACLAVVVGTIGGVFLHAFFIGPPTQEGDNW